MILMEDLLVETVEDRFLYDKNFFNNSKFKMYPATWSRFKNGKVSMLDMKFDKVFNMINYLFTPLEIYLIVSMQDKNRKSKDYYLRKKEILKSWPENIEVIPKRYTYPNGEQSALFLSIKKDDFLSLSFTINDKSLLDVFGTEIGKDLIMKNIDKLK